MNRASPRLLLPAVLLVLLAAPATAAGGDLQAEGVTLWGLRDLEAPLAFLERTGQGDADFELTAKSLRVETDRRDVVVGAVGTEATTETTEHDDPTVVGVSIRADARLVVLPTNAVLAVEGGDCGRLHTPAASTHAHAPTLDGRDTTNVPLGAALGWTPCAGSATTITGDFVVALWAWDAEVRDARGTTPLPSGQGDASQGNVGAREQFLFARDATLRLPPGAQTAYVEDVSVAARGVHLRAASGFLGETPVSGDADLYGDLDLRLAGQGATAPLAAHVGGVVTDAFIDDAAVHVGEPVQGAWWPWAAVAALVPIGAYVHARPHLRYWRNERTGGELGTLVPQDRRQRRGVGLWIMARAAERRRNYRLSHRRASRANDLFRPFPEAQFTRAVAAGRLGHHADAMTDFLDLYNRHDEPAGRAAAACGIAQACTRLGKWDAAREWLERAAHESTEYARAAASDPEFAPFAGETWFEALRQEERSVDPFSGPGAMDPSFH